MEPRPTLVQPKERGNPMFGVSKLWGNGVKTAVTAQCRAPYSPKWAWNLVVARPVGVFIPPLSLINCQHRNASAIFMHQNCDIRCWLVKARRVAVRSVFLCWSGELETSRLRLHFVPHGPYRSVRNSATRGLNETYELVDCYCSGSATDGRDLTLMTRTHPNRACHWPLATAPKIIDNIHYEHSRQLQCIRSFAIILRGRLYFVMIFLMSRSHQICQQSDANNSLQNPAFLLFFKFYAITYCVTTRYAQVCASSDAWTVGHLSTSPFTASHCPAKDISVPLSEIYCTYHVTDSTRTAAPGLLPLLGRPPGVSEWVEFNAPLDTI